MSSGRRRRLQDMSAPALASILLASADPVRLRAWYVDVLDARPDRSGFLNVGRVAMLIDRREVAARCAEPGRVILNFEVPDVRAVERLLVAREAVWIREVESTPWGRIGTVLDPDGNYVQVIDGTGRRT
jgi:predicted enzyme related to lactoylglutathione lyase